MAVKDLENGVSIILCTYNGKVRLEETLRHIVNQIHICNAELILVDNASNDGSKEFGDNWWKENGVFTIKYKSYSQPIPGKSNAQELGFTKASYEFLLVCDDDNWLSKEYIQIAYDIMSANRNIGALGGWSEAVFEKTKPAWFDTYAHLYAVAKQGGESGDITNKKGCLFGAGMVLRKSHWIYLREIGFKPLLTCYRGKTMSYGEDTEYSYVLRLVGYEIWYDERLYFQHYMPEKRLNLTAIKNVKKAISKAGFVANVYVDILKGKKITRKFFFKKFLKEVKKSFYINIKRRLIGTFEEKELAKEYFRNLYRLVFSYSEYSKIRTNINNWLPK